ncbi:MAG: HD domain-containing protein [Pseudolabrys sp.]|nr:HD domain-containing protein [Pseudolabrys sp.]MDP2294483.1 HD domain-containing protein [Pseudolabrys sp.]
MNLQRRNYTWNKLPLPPDQPAGPFAYTWTAERVKKVFDKPLYQELIGASAFRRLADIRFLGAIDYLIHPTGRQFTRRRHTRLEHTLGVAHLALTYSRLMGLSNRDEELLVSAALLHDIGHAPLSHSVEAAFNKHFGIDHHAASAQIILGTAPPNARDLNVAPILSAFGVKPDEVISLVAGRLEGKAYNFLFAHPINIDTLEAISRTETYFKSSQTSPTPDVVLLSLIRLTQMEKIDEFWRLKNRVYALWIQSPLGLFADHVAQKYVELNIDAFSIDDFFLSERALRKKHPFLFSCLSEARKNLIKDGAVNALPVEIPAQLRRFFLDETAAPGSANRYRQEKKSVLIGFAGIRQTAIQQLSTPNQ